MKIQDGAGRNPDARTTAGGQITTYAVSESEQYAASRDGRLFNINTELIAFTGTGESALLHFKNDEAPVNGESSIVIAAIIIGIGTRSATITDLPEIRIYRNPTGGTIVDDANNAEIVGNNNFSSGDGLSSTTLAYSASATGKTTTGGAKHILGYGQEGRTTLPIDLVLGRNASLSVTIDLNTSGGANVYAALVCYKRDPNLKSG